MTQAGAIMRAWLLLGAAAIGEHAAELTELDARIGDGDHGINLDRGFSSVVERMAAADAADLDAGGLLLVAGRTLISTVGGASGPLYGTFLLEMAGPLAGVELLEAPILAAAWRAGAAGVARRGRSTAGEKTMLDALIPASEALARGTRLVEAVQLAAAAADAGRLATVPMLATKGRASYLGPRSIGHADPGATSAALLTEALARAVIGQVGEGTEASR